MFVIYNRQLSEVVCRFDLDVIGDVWLLGEIFLLPEIERSRGNSVELIRKIYTSLITALRLECWVFLYLCQLKWDDNTRLLLYNDIPTLTTI